MCALRAPLVHSLALLFGAMLVLAGCDVLEEEGAGESDFMGLSMAATGDASTPFVAVHEAGERLGIAANPATGEVTGATLLGDNGQELVVFTAPDGTPERLVVEGYVFVFENVRSSLADVVMIEPDGDLHVARDVAYDSEFTLTEGRPGYASAQGGGNDIARAAQAAGLGISISTCVVTSAMAVTGSFATLGVAAPAAATIIFGCGAAVVSVLAEYQRVHGQDGTVLQQTDEGFNQISAGINTVQCAGADPIACIQLVLQGINAAFSEGRITEAQREELIRQAEGLLQSGGGDVQVTLTWNTTADIDLWVTDPSGERIYFGNRTSASGGQLDVDDRDGFGPENIFWPAGGAPAGTYLVDVDHWSGASPTNYTVRTVVQGVTRTFTGTLTSNETDRVTTFTVTGVQPAPPDSSPALGSPSPLAATK